MSGIPPVPVDSDGNSHLTDVQRLSMTVGGLSTRLGGFEGRMEKLESNSNLLADKVSQGFSEIGKLIAANRDAMMTQMQANRDSVNQELATRAKTPWALILPAGTLTLGIVLAIGSLVAYSINSNIARVETAAIGGIARIDQDQRAFEKEARSMVVPRDEIRVVTELRNKMLDALEKRLEKLEGRASK